MALYLVHVIVLNEIKLVIHGPFNWEKVEKIKGIKDWDKGIYMCCESFKMIENTPNLPF